MEAPLQAILVQGEQARDEVKSGRKEITIRARWRDYQYGSVLIGCYELDWAVMAWIQFVRHTKLKHVTPVEYIEDGFSTYKDFKEGLRRFYPEIDDNFPVTIVRWVID